MPRTALITGATGQDGSYLAEFLVARDYRVVGVARHAPAPGSGIPGVDYRAADVGVAGVMHGIAHDVAPDEIYHLAGETSVSRTWDDPSATIAAVAGVTHVLDAARQRAGVRVLLASSSEIFGLPATSPQDETTPPAPAHPYGAAKAFALWMGRAYRRGHGIHCSSAILYNHESPRRPPTFVTRKITRGIADIVQGRTATLRLGNLDARRDWGFAGDYVDAMWRMVQMQDADDYVIGTGVSRSVREFCAVAFAAAGLDFRNHVVVDNALLRPVDAQTLVADATRARDRFGWSASTDFESMVRAMVAADLER